MKPLIRLILAAIGLACHWVSAADKSGVSPNTISIPKGPGSIEGLGDAFQPQLNTGTASYGLSIQVPPGPGGHAPEMKLTYEGGAGNGPLGLGWQISIPFIQRQTEKGVPRYVDAANGLDDDHDGIVDETDEVDKFVSGSKEDLIPIDATTFRSESEANFIRYRRVGEGWEGTQPDGTVMRYGQSAESRVKDGNNVFRWLMDTVTDTKGNVIYFSYTSFPGVVNLNQLYLKRIEYACANPSTGPKHFLEFTYQPRSDWFEDCRSGFPVRTGMRLQSISVASQGVAMAGHAEDDRDGDGTVDYLHRRYEFAYWAYAGAQSHWSYLHTVIMIGADGVNGLPPARFSYSFCHPPQSLSAVGRIIGSSNAPATVMDSPLVEFVDLNADGLPDILKTTANGGSHNVNYNEGERSLPGGGKVIRWSSSREVPSSDGQAWNINLQSGATPQESIAHLADLDADGLADLVYKSPSNQVFYFKNQRALGWGDRKPMAAQGESPPSPFANAFCKSYDADFDKRMDVIQSIAGGLQYRVWFNLGGQAFSEPVTVDQTDGLPLSDSAVHLVDWNGDRMLDVVRVEANSMIITAALGHGRFLAQRTVAIPGGPLSPSEISKASLRDLTGDGIAELIVERPEPGVLWYWINLGNDALAPRREITGLPAFGSGMVVRWADLNGNGTTDYILADSDEDSAIQVVDLAELMNCTTAASLLTRVENGIGRITGIEYSTSTVFALADADIGQAWAGPLPFPVSVVSRIVNDDSNGHSYETTFVYHDGYYDGVEQEFRGFGKVDVIDAGDASQPMLVTRSTFDTGRVHKAMKGRLLRLTTEQGNGEVFTDHQTLWTDPPRLLHAGIDGREVRFAVPYESRKDITERGQGSPRLLVSQMDFDNYGNQVALRDYGIVEGANRSAFDDERFTTTLYAINPALWILRTPAQVEVGDENGALISRSRMFYDDETFSSGNFQQVTRGELTLKLEWVNLAAGPIIQAARTKYDGHGNVAVLLDPLATDENGGHVRRIGWDTVFHSYPVTETIQLGGGKAPLLYTAEYDIGFGEVIAATDFNSQRTDFGYDGFGRLTSMVKPGDTVAMPTAEYSYHLAVPHGTDGIINFVETRILDRDVAAPGSKQDHYLISREFVDGLGRKVLSKTEAEPATPGGAPRVAVNGAVLFNARTKPAAALNPFFSVTSSLDFENIEAPGWSGTFSENGALVTLGLAAAHKSSTIYDATGREVEIINPDGTRKRTLFEPLVTRSFDENDNDPASPHADTPMVHHKDGLGRLMQVDEITRLNDDGTPAGSLRAWTTRYAYDLNDQLITITDSQNNVKRQLFDGLKRMTWMNDPDRGIMTFHYDDASNLVESTDAKSQHIVYTYDGANRILSEDYLDEGLPFSRNLSFNPALPVSAANRPDVSYFYDTAVPGLSMGDGSTSTAGHVLGRLTTVWDLSGEEHTSYDARGRIEWAVKRITDPKHGGLVSFRTGFGYDSLDRLRRVEYPDGDFVPYDYNERSLLASISGGPTRHIISGVDYLPSGQMSAQRYGNSTHTDYNYDPRLRLKTLLTTSSALGSQFLHYGYDFDAASNLRSITDSRPATVVPAGDARRNTQIFGYDDLYRIASVQYSFAAPSEAAANNGGIAYRYDRIGNLLAQTSGLNHQEKGLSVANLGNLSYGGTAGTSARNGRAANDPPGPHALTAVSDGSRTYPYDANGNMTLLDGMTSAWDFKDRLTTVETPEMRADYVYDYTDRRITKRVMQKAAPGHVSTVLYVGKYFEVREGETPTKFIWNGETRVARVTGSLSTNLRVQRLRLQQGWNLVSLAIDSTESLSKLSASAPNVMLEAYLHQPASGTFAPLAANTALPAGSVLWMKASTSATLHLLGTMPNAPPALAAVTPQGKFYPTGFDGLTTAAQQNGAAIWRFASDTQRWQNRLAPPLQALSDTPAKLPSGEAFFVHSTTAADVQVPDSALAIRYYHQDHLGSSSVMTDASGRLVEESTYYPFGHPRLEHRPTGIREDYQFTQKERDAESGLNYFEARFLAASLGRFTRVDPLASAMPQAWIGAPQKMNLYAYCANQPIVCVDPTGLDPVQGIVTEYADRFGGYLAENGGMAGAVAGTGIYTAAAYLDPTENAANAGQQLGIAFDSSKSGLERVGGAMGAVGYSAATVLDGIGLKAFTGLFSKVGPKALAHSVGNVNKGTNNLISLQATESFDGGKFEVFKTTKEIIVSRAYGGKSGQLGEFFGKSAPTSSLDAEEMYNIKKFGNDASRVATIKIPVGTTIYHGKVAGGVGEQIYIPKSQNVEFEILDDQPLPRGWPP